ncbi:MAG: WecB/TagA/CpsF family glycosyltransferase [Clostridiales bacterium]|nr:WecB/TagA/CpsF family glycosyltransferase [Clostridiales bacterium]
MKSPACLLGISFFPVDIKEALTEVVSRIPNRTGEYFCFPGVHLVMEGFKNPRIKNILNNSAGNFPDGMGVAWALKFSKKNSFKDRVRGVDFMVKLCQYAAQNNLKIFLYGNTKDTLIKLEERLKTVFPGINVVGSISPPFRPISKEEDKYITGQINAVDPDILFVSLGAPKQERWMAEHKGKIKSLQFGVGAAFDFIVGKVRQAPRWIQRAGIEWLFRLPQQPYKTIYRMSFFPEFVIRVLIELLKKKK